MPAQADSCEAVDRLVVACRLDDAAVAGDIAEQHGQTAVLQVRMLQVAYAAFFPVQIGRRIGGVLRAELQVMLFGRRDPCADFRFDGHVGTSQVVQSDRFGERRAVHSSDRRVDQSPPVQFAQDGENASGPVDVLYVVMRVGRYLADDGDAARQAVDVAHREVHARLLSDDEPPMAMSIDMAFRKAARVAIERGSTASLSSK